jgi:UDP-N-acetyl-D-mannosaminuronic acid dehydrogenase
MDEHLAFGVKVYDPFIKERMVDHQFMNFEDFLNEIEILVIITAHNHIKNNFDLVKDKLILDTKNIFNFDGVYKL